MNTRKPVGKPGLAGRNSLMKRLGALFALAIIAAAGSTRPAATPAPTATVFSPPVVTVTPLQPTTPFVPLPSAPTPEPTTQPSTLPGEEILPPAAGTSVSDPVTRIVDLPGNQAKGDPAPDFTARVVGGAFRLSEHRGAFVLLFPTVVGCGDCIFVMQEMTAAYPDYRGRGLKVVILNLYPEDVPETWQPFADYFAEPEFIWGVVNSTDFLVQYNIQSLGTTLLVDPDGRLAFRREYPLLSDEFRQLFALAAGSS